MLTQEQINEIRAKSGLPPLSQNNSPTRQNTVGKYDYLLKESSKQKKGLEGLGQRMGGTSGLTEIGERRGAQFLRAADEKQGILSKGLQATGAVLGGATDVMRLGASKAYNALPDFIKKPIASSVDAVGNVKMLGGQTIGESFGNISQVAKETEMLGGRTLGESIKTTFDPETEIGRNLSATKDIAEFAGTVYTADQVLKLGMSTVDSSISGIKKGAKNINNWFNELDTTAKPSGLQTSVGENMIKLGEKIQDTVIRPTRADMRNGYRTQNVTKYGLNGPLGEMQPKVTGMLKESITKLNNTIAKQGKAPAIDLNQALDDVAKAMNERGLKNLGTKASINNTINNIKAELDSIAPGWKDSPVSFQDAVNAKRAAGLNGSFLHGQVTSGLSAEERVWNNLYTVLRDSTNKAAKGTLYQALNTKISELIPIEQAVVRAVPIAMRNNVLSLTDIISGVASVSSPQALSFGILQRLLKSGEVAKILVEGGKYLIK